MEWFSMTTQLTLKENSKMSKEQMNMKTYYLLADGQGLEGFSDEAGSGFFYAMRANANSWRDCVAAQIKLPEKDGQFILSEIEAFISGEEKSREFWRNLYNLLRAMMNGNEVTIIGGNYDSFCRIPWRDELEDKFQEWMSHHFKTGVMVPPNWYESSPDNPSPVKPNPRASSPVNPTFKKVV